MSNVLTNTVPPIFALQVTLAVGELVLPQAEYAVRTLSATTSLAATGVPAAAMHALAKVASAARTAMDTSTQ